MSSSTMTPVGAVARGLAAETSGTTVPDLLPSARHQLESGDRTVANVLGAHLVYGLTTAVTFRLLSPRRST